MPESRIVGIISKPDVERAKAIVPALLEWLQARGIGARYDDQTAAYIGRAGLAREQVPEGTEMVIVLGGDGTLLSAARAIGSRDTPLFAVNLGGLGFLTAITVEEIFPDLERALDGQHRVTRRSTLTCELWRGDEKIGMYEALNDAVLAKAQIARMIDLETHIDGHYVSTFRADGLIVATPTGSTAYSLSAGGPIVLPHVACLCLTPVCPHTLTYRPVIVPATSIIEVRCLSEDATAYLTIDGQVGEVLRQRDRIVCRSSPHTISLIRPPKLLFFDVLREKLKWGEG
ncbi:MAG: NAD(+)/NADH kinase [Bryobacteraceae bacterium]